MLRLLDSKTRVFFPSEEKDARFQAPLSSPVERNRARSAFKRFFPPKSLRKREVLISLGQKWRVFGIHWLELSQTYSAADSIGFPRWITSLWRNDVGRIQGGMPPWLQDALKSPRRGSSERERASERGRGKAKLFPLQGD